MTMTTLKQLENHGEFIARHIGPRADETTEMLAELGVSSLEELIQDTVPGAIRREPFLSIGAPMTERDALAKLKTIASKNKVYTSFIGLGYYDTLVPNVILRNVLENPGWYTAYTPYQPEIAQGRLQAILNFQQMTMDLTGLDLASASLLDEATAAAEAMAMAKRVSKSKSNSFYVADTVFPQTIDVVKTRAEHFGFDVIVGSAQDAVNHDIFGALLQYPDRYGQIDDLEHLIGAIQAKQGIVAVAADIMSLVMLKAPGEMGADMVLGSAQRFGVPMGYGGPHAAFFATRDKFKRALPGRIIGVSKDSRDGAALRMAMQTREQHIRREKATSNICTAQVLLANIAAFYAVYHGPEGLKAIANRIHAFTKALAKGLDRLGHEVAHDDFFDTLRVIPGEGFDAEGLVSSARDSYRINLRAYDDGSVGIALDEVVDAEDVNDLLAVFA